MLILYADTRIFFGKIHNSKIGENFLDYLSFSWFIRCRFFHFISLLFLFCISIFARPFSLSVFLFKAFSFYISIIMEVNQLSHKKPQITIFNLFLDSLLKKNLTHYQKKYFFCSKKYMTHMFYFRDFSCVFICAKFFSPINLVMVSVFSTHTNDSHKRVIGDDFSSSTLMEFF